MSIIKITINGRNYEFGQLVGGIGWPGERPGFVVVVGEELKPLPGTETKCCRVVEEAEGEDLRSLIRHGIRIQRSAGRSIQFYGRTQQSAEQAPQGMKFLDSWNRDVLSRKSRESTFHVYEAPHSQEGNLEYHVNVIKERLYGDPVSLCLLENGELIKCLQDLRITDVPQATDSQHPAIAALGYAITALMEYRVDPDEERRTELINEELAIHGSD